MFVECLLYPNMYLAPVDSIPCVRSRGLQNALVQWLKICEVFVSLFIETTLVIDDEGTQNAKDVIRCSAVMLSIFRSEVNPLISEVMN